MKNSFFISASDLFIKMIRSLVISAFLISFNACGGDKSSKPDTENNDMGAEPSFRDRDKELERMHEDSMKGRDDHSNDTINRNSSTQPKY